MDHPRKSEFLHQLANCCVDFYNNPSGIEVVSGTPRSLAEYISPVIIVENLIRTGFFERR